jgi:2-dehydro-3-deoxyphosphogluconate aldolase / (4S)-4-hydroxy-2-oxoglutarate aldolase
MRTTRTAEDVFKAISATKIVPVFYHDDLSTAKAMIKACYDGGIRVFEWVARGNQAAAHFPALQQYILEHYADMILGVGTILTGSQAEDFIALGASFLVSPVYSADVMEKAHAAKVSYLPGCFTPTEIFNAYQKGCSWVKIFPGDAITPTYVKGIKAVFPQVNIMVTGGVLPQKENIQNWLTNGADAVGIGNQLFKALTYESVAALLKNIMPV